MERDLEDPLNGSGHIGPGIPVGHREDIHIVDRVAIHLQQLVGVEEHRVIQLGRQVFHLSYLNLQL